MRWFLAAALMAALTLGTAARPPVALAAPAPATLGMPPSWFLPLSVKVIARILQILDWLEDDLRAQVHRPGDYDPPPVIVPVLEGVRSGGSTSAAPAGRAAVRPIGMIP